MYIHNYQIHNVLNEYRKQLTRGPEGTGRKTSSGQTRNDRVEISDNGQRQSIIDQVSAEIVDRITKSGARNRFEDALAAYLANPSYPGNNNQGKEFTYTFIDEYDRKLTNRFEIQNLSTALGGLKDNPEIPPQAHNPVDVAAAVDLSPGGE